MEKLTQLEALLLTAVLENCVDQLAILGYIMPVSHEGKTDISHVRASVLFKKIPLVFLLVFYVSYQHSLNIHSGIFFCRVLHDPSGKKQYKRTDDQF